MTHSYYAWDTRNKQRDWFCKLVYLDWYKIIVHIDIHVDIEFVY